MNYSISRLSDYPAVVAEWFEDFDYAKERQRHDQELVDLLNEQPEPVMLILVSLQYEMSINTLLEATRNAMSRQVSPVTHPKVASVVLVNEDPILRGSLNGFRKFGLTKDLFVVSSMDEAFALVARG